MATDALGNPNNPIPSEFPVTATYEPRQFQLGVKVQFLGEPAQLSQE